MAVQRCSALLCSELPALFIVKQRPFPHREKESEPGLLNPLKWIDSAGQQLTPTQIWAENTPFGYRLNILLYVQFKEEKLEGKH